MKAFLITPLSAERARETPEVFEAVQRAIAEAARRAGVELIHPAQMSRAGAIMDKQVQPEIETADVVLALITGQNPNVFFELGFTRRDAILICRSAEYVPFDIRHHRYWTYGTAEELASLPSRLEDAIRQTLTAGERPNQRHPPARPPATAVDTIAHL